LRRPLVRWLALVVLLAGCGEEVGRREVTRPGRVPLEQTAAERFGFSFVWARPDGWTTQPQTPMRLASFEVGPEAECSLSVAGGTVEANIARWRRQMGQGPAGEGEMTSAERVELFGEAAPLVVIEGTFEDMTGAQHEDWTLVGAIQEHHPGELVFVKMIGPTASVAPQRERFEAFCRSIESAHE